MFVTVTDTVFVPARRLTPTTLGDAYEPELATGCPFNDKSAWLSTANCNTAGFAAAVEDTKNDFVNVTTRFAGSAC